MYTLCKGQVHPRTGYEGPEEEWRYSSTLYLTSALDGVGGPCHAPAASPSGKIWYLLYRRLGGPQGRSGRVRKISPPTGIRSPDRTARSESLYRLSYPDQRFLSCTESKVVLCKRLAAVSLVWASPQLPPGLKREPKIKAENEANQETGLQAH
jgi:hypothetical protein